MKTLQLRVLDKAKFDKLKQFAFYKSELTGVMGFDLSRVSIDMPELQELIKDIDAPVIKESKEKENKYIVDVNNCTGNIYLTAPFDYISFCNGRIIKGTNTAYIDYENLLNVNALIRYGLVEPTKVFRDYFPEMNENSLIKDFHSFTSYTKFRKYNRWTFKLYFEEKGKDINTLKISDVNLFDSNKSAKTFIEIKGEIIDVDKNPKNQKAMIKADGKTYEINFHGWYWKFDPCWEVGNIVKLWCTKIYGDTGYFKIVDPTILPLDINIDNVDKFLDLVSPLINRTYPSNLYNKIYGEYQIRKK